MVEPLENTMRYATDDEAEAASRELMVWLADGGDVDTLPSAMPRLSADRLLGLFGYADEAQEAPADLLVETAQRIPQVDSNETGRVILECYISGFDEEILRAINADYGVAIQGLRSVIQYRDKEAADNRGLLAASGQSTAPVAPKAYANAWWTSIRVIPFKPLKDAVPYVSEKQLPGVGSRGDDAIHWSQKGKCAEIDPELFFPEKNDTAKTAKDICASCEVRADCLTYSLESDEHFGVWGGLSDRERRAYKKSLGANIYTDNKQRVEQLVQLLTLDPNTEIEEIITKLCADEKLYDELIENVIDWFTGAKLPPKLLKKVGYYFCGADVAQICPKPTDLKVIQTALTTLAKYISNTEHGMDEPVLHFWHRAQTALGEATTEDAA